MGITRDSSGAVDEDEDHATKGPSDPQKANSVTFVKVICLLVADDGGYSDVEEEKGGYKLGDYSSVIGPGFKLCEVKEWCWRWVNVVFSMGLTLFAHFLRHFFSHSFTLLPALKKKKKKFSCFESSTRVESGFKGFFKRTGKKCKETVHYMDETRVFSELKK